MSGEEAGQLNTGVHKALWERCAALNIPLWRFDSCGNTVSEPDMPAANALRTPEMQRRLAELVREHVRHHAQAVTVCDGCCAILMPDWIGSQLLGTSVALVIETKAVDTEAFQKLCDIPRSGVADNTRSIIAPLLRETRREADHVIAMLKWMHADLVEASRQRQTLDQFGEKLVQSYEETNAMFRLARYINCVDDPHALMRLICQQLHAIFPFRWIAVGFNQRSLGVPELTGRVITVGTIPCAEDTFREQLGHLINQWTVNDWTRFLTPETSALAALVGSEVVADPIAHDGHVVGVLVAGNKTGPDADLSSLETQFLDATADFLGVFHENLARFAEQHALFLGTVKALTAAIDAKDRYTFGHSERVACLAAHMARAMRLSAEEVEDYHIAGLVHDVGKIGVPEQILCKPAKLTDAEFEQIKRHPRIGYQILKDIPRLTDILPGVLHHHERWDGRGYPDGLQGENIPVIARVLSLADSFDAMSSSRAYRAALPREQVLAEVQRCAGIQFDPELADIFVRLDLTVFDEMLARHQNITQQAA